MIIKNISNTKKNVAKIMDGFVEREKIDFSKIIERDNNKLKNYYKKIISKKTPFYLFDKKQLEINIDNLKNAFSKYVENLEIFYAVKSNPYEDILETAVEKNIGLDVSSIREFKFALEKKCNKIIFTGPGKTEDDLRFILKHNDKTIINIDSFNELKKLGEISSKMKIKIRVGVRIYTKYHGSWSKFGIKLEDLKKFIEESLKYKFVNLCGIQIHMSWNVNSEPYKKAFKEIGLYLKTLPKEYLEIFNFFDFGGGIMPQFYEAYYPWKDKQGMILKAINDFFGEETQFKDKYYLSKSESLESFGSGIGLYLKKFIAPYLKCKYHCEPGRILNYNTMHIVFKVIDIKDNNIVIVDGGINMVGWEKYENSYYPILNITNPSNKEIACKIYGPLCTPDDFWSNYVFAKKIEENDILVMFNQGDYTYTLAQNFIREIPEVVDLIKL